MLTPAWRPTPGTPSRSFKLHLWRGRRLDDATFEDEVADPKLPVEDKLVLEAVEDDDIKSGDAAEGQGVGPEAAGLELVSPGADVDQFGAGQTAKGGGEEVEGEREVGI
ncbi:hypothetical protein ACFX15_044539 [Malus domestica]